jgi:hypothetical protein
MRDRRLLYASVLSISALAAGASPARAQTCNNASGACNTASNLNTGPSAVGFIGQVSGTGTGLEGLAPNGGYGVYGQGTGSAAVGVEGFNPSGGSGVVGVGSGTTGIGVRGFTNPATGTGVFGTSGTGIGVSAQLTGSSGFALFAAAPTSGSALAGSFSGNVRVNGNLVVTGTINGSSDARLKEDVKDARYGLADVMRLRPVSFKWKDKRSTDVQRGFIAQELQQVLPDLVSTDTGTGMLQVNYLGLLPVAIKAIRDQQEVIRRQEARLEALEHERRTTLSSLLPGGLGRGLGGGLALGLLPLGLVVGLRRRRDQG